MLSLLVRTKKMQKRVVQMLGPQICAQYRTIWYLLGITSTWEMQTTFSRLLFTIWLLDRISLWEGRSEGEGQRWSSPQHSHKCFRTTLFTVNRLNMLWESLQKSSKNAAASRQPFEGLWFSSSGEKKLSMSTFC